jgi:anaphase-promoting complex subunit 8
MKREGLDTIEALLYLAHYWKDLGQMAEAEHYCLRLLDFAGKVRTYLVAVALPRRRRVSFL